MQSLEKIFLLYISIAIQYSKESKAALFLFFSFTEWYPHLHHVLEAPGSNPSSGDHVRVQAISVQEYHTAEAYLKTGTPIIS